MYTPNGSYGAGNPYGAGGYNAMPTYGQPAADYQQQQQQQSQTPIVSPILRRRPAADSASSYAGSGSRNGASGAGGTGAGGTGATPRSVVKKLDFMFPKVDKEYTVKTDGGGVMSVICYCLIAVLVLAEILAWRYQNQTTKEHIFVDTSLGKRMRVNLNITFPGLACEDLHVDVMDVAGDSQLNIEDTMVKTRLNSKGRLLGDVPEPAESNKHKHIQVKKQNILREEINKTSYCGPCFGAQEKEGDCCNTCDDLIAAYEKKKWRTDIIVQTSEQCIREHRDRSSEPKLMRKGEGCNLQGSMTLNRVAGNFHIAMGEGIEREGRHIHSFVPEDTPNFNASHIIHRLSFGSPDDELLQDAATATTVAAATIDDYTQASLDGVSKIVTKEHGTTGLFQYFIKIVPTTYVEGDTAGSSSTSSSLATSSQGGGKKETNRYFFTERFRPLISQLFAEDDDHLMDDDDRYLLGLDNMEEEPNSDSSDSSSDSSIDEKLNNVTLSNEEKEKLLLEKEKRWRERRQRRIDREQRRTEKKKEQKNKYRAAKAGGGDPRIPRSRHQNSAHDSHHHVRNAILPGVFFIYEIYPFAVEVSQSKVPLTHLLIRIMATVGGVFTIVRWADHFFYSRHPSGSGGAGFRRSKSGSS